MKNIMAAFIIATLLLACNNRKEPTGDTSSIKVEHKEEEHDRKNEGLVLNNGAKWKADSSTVINVAILKDVISNNKKEGLEDYHSAAAGLQEGLNKMVKECKMKGADHDALHQWLEPLMAKNKSLQSSTSVEDASSIFSGIETQVALFPQYFE